MTLCTDVFQGEQLILATNGILRLGQGRQITEELESGWNCMTVDVDKGIVVAGTDGKLRFVKGWDMACY